MNELIYKLNATKLEVPFIIRPESRDFPRAKIRTSTPKCQKNPINLNSTNRPSTPRILPKYIYLKESTKSRPQSSKPSNKPQPAMSTILLNNFTNLDKCQQENTMKDSYLLHASTILIQNTRSTYRVKNPTRILNFQKPKYKLNKTIR